MESFAYILILTLAIATLFFAIAFRDPPKIGKRSLRDPVDPASPHPTVGAFSWLQMGCIRAASTGNDP